MVLRSFRLPLPLKRLLLTGSFSEFGIFEMRKTGISSTKIKICRNLAGSAYSRPGTWWGQIRCFKSRVRSRPFCKSSSVGSVNWAEDIPLVACIRSLHQVPLANWAEDFPLVGAHSHASSRWFSMVRLPWQMLVWLPAARLDANFDIP